MEEISKTQYLAKRKHGYAGTRAELINPDAEWMGDAAHWAMVGPPRGTALTPVVVVDD